MILAAIIALLFTAVHASRPAPATGRIPAISPTIQPHGPADAARDTPPMYYAALTIASVLSPPYSARTADGSRALVSQDYIAIRRTSSGAVMATVKPPPGFQAFSMVTGTSMADEFLVAAQRPSPTSAYRPVPGTVRLFTLRLDEPPERGATLTPLPVPDIPGDEFWSAAMSPDASRLAVAVTIGSVIAPPGGDRPLSQPTRLVYVYSLPGGAGTAKTWWVTAPGRVFNGPRLDPGLLSWSADSRLLGINWRDPAPGLRVLSTESPGGSLLAASRMVTFPGGGSRGTLGCGDDATLTASAKLIVCAGYGTPDGEAIPPSDESRASVLELDATTGRVLEAVFPPSAGATPVQDLRLLWVSPSGYAVVVASGAGSALPPTMTILTGPGGQPESLPLGPDVTELAW
jgi:hypothetical protein